MNWNVSLSTHVFVCGWVYVHGCNILPQIHIKYEQVNMKYSISLKKISHIFRQCVLVNYAGKQLVSGVSVSQELTFSHQAFRVKITFLLKVKQPCLIKNDTSINSPFRLGRSVVQCMPLCVCLNREIFITPRHWTKSKVIHALINC